ncbi:hypothetical protein ZYGR_0W00580 [Zygosaccharomyces rouxii]|uniref:Uncharacterized protein n=1 Tax=Zygosaccharomyces rouxii TaxID=4956 RepID=A0A1Q3A4A2_ZYGRO|nr:hypothetical protein ZYGR_0W00580 [Zygosaccharomyces rouxii]
MSVSNLVREAEQLYEQGDHGEAVARLTTALKSNPNDQDTQKIEELINKLGLHAFENGAGNGSRDIGGSGERGIGTQLASSFFAPSGSNSAQLGKLAMLGTILASNQKGSGGGLQTAISLFTGHQKSSSGSAGGWASFASKFFSNGKGQAPSSGGYGGQPHQDTSTFSKLSSLANSYMSNQGGPTGGQYGSQEGHHGGGYAQGGYAQGGYAQGGYAQGGYGGYGGPQEGHYGGGYAQAGHGGSNNASGSQSKLGAVASMASNYLSGNGNKPAHGAESNHNESGHGDGLSSLASVASNIMGHGKGRHEPPSAYGNPNMGDNGFNFTGGSHLAPL